MNAHAESRLIDGLKKSQPVNGWVFDYEYPGFFAFYKGEATVYCTPDHAHPKYISIQVADVDLNSDDELNRDIPYTSPLTVKQFIEIITPVLDQVEMAIKAKAVRS